MPASRAFAGAMDVECRETADATEAALKPSNILSRFSGFVSPHNRLMPALPTRNTTLHSSRSRSGRPDITGVLL